MIFFNREEIFVPADSPLAHSNIASFMGIYFHKCL